MLLRLLDKKGLSIVSKLHVQLYRFPVDFYIDLRSQTKAFCEKHFGLHREVQHGINAVCSCTTQFMVKKIKPRASDLPEELELSQRRKQTGNSLYVARCFQQMPHASMHVWN